MKYYRSNFFADGMYQGPFCTERKMANFYSNFSLSVVRKYPFYQLKTLLLVQKGFTFHSIFKNPLLLQKSLTFHSISRRSIAQWGNSILLENLTFIFNSTFFSTNTLEHDHNSRQILDIRYQSQNCCFLYSNSNSLCHGERVHITQILFVFVGCC